jgi:hypothetical protein
MSGAFYEVHTGTVTNIKDPEKRGRLMVKLPTLFEDDYPDWVDPCFPFAGSNCGFFALPQVGVAIECEVHRGSGPDASIDTPSCKWRGALYNRVDQIPEEFRERYPFCLGFKSPAGHILMFDDSEGKEFLLLSHAKKQKTLLCFDRNGSVALHCEAASGAVFGIELDATRGMVQVSGNAMVEIKAKGHVSIDAPAVTICGRPVAHNGEPL